MLCGAARLILTTRCVPGPGQCPGLVERIELRHVLGGQGEVEDLSVLADSLAVGRLGDDRNIVLKAPPQQHLGGRPTHALGYAAHRLVGQVPAGSERAVGLERDVPLSASIEQPAPVLH